ncbi:hypothetical protein KSP40_PGU003396 [Platanthera guangdongensis]|uniref:Uncharacterized protein n=1 Tax=Platanthera guangdongensis TaxID=2320717 RepID=A0ABR2ML96_9ASPA
MVCAWSHPSAQQGEVPVQEPTEDENTCHGIGLQVDLPLGRTCSGHPGGSDIHHYLQDGIHLKYFKLQLKLAYEQESEKIKRKFEALLQGAEREYSFSSSSFGQS